MKREQARKILETLGMPLAQQNENAVYTLLAFAGVRSTTPWSEATDVRRTPHDVIRFAFDAYGKRYAENTRETIRRQAIHQFVQGGILVRNPDDPTLPTNSPRTHYALTPEALEVVRSYGTAAFEEAAARFRSSQAGGLVHRYGRARVDASVSVVLPDGHGLVLSPGMHNTLQAKIVEDFLPRFASGARVLYIGDTDLKTKWVLEADLANIGVPVTKHDKLPDVVLYDSAKNWLFLVEAVTSHGPVSPKRHLELEELLEACDAGRVYVSAFPSFREFKKHAADIAWETEVWVAEFPEHLLHYNGDRFIGPRR